jgi:hypothetical protein
MSSSLFGSDFGEGATEGWSEAQGSAFFGSAYFLLCGKVRIEFSKLAMVNTTGVWPLRAIVH